MKTVLITGASRGIGKALANKFLEEGYFVIGTSTNRNTDSNHENFKVVQLDLSNPGSINSCVKEIKELGKNIDVLVNNAAMAVEEEIESDQINIDYLRKTLEVNLIGIVDFTEKIIPAINYGGHIINVSSRAGSLDYKVYRLNYPAYRISKTALNMVTKIWSERLDGKITVSSTHPGWVKTDMGGSDAEEEPGVAAESIFKLANSKVETGQFWFKGEKFPW